MKKDPEQGISLDRVDLRILSELQLNGRITHTRLAEEVGLSTTPCTERVRRLERLGYITSYGARLNPRLLDPRTARLR